jgi:hypothetical protein
MLELVQFSAQMYALISPVYIPLYINSGLSRCVCLHFLRFLRQAAVLLKTKKIVQL